MDGIFNIYKEAGFTSFDVAAKLRGILKQKKIGHTGTLDPDATGVLVVCAGKATKLCGYLTDTDKEYEAVLRLGITTDTQDMSGKILSRQDVFVTKEQAKNAIHSFVGRQEQIPPMYSALKVGGKKLCDLARQGIEVERRAREIEIYSIEILSMELPRIWMRVRCSKGTYIRTLCADIGERLGCGGCMERLTRTQAAGFRIEDAHSLRELQAASDGTDAAGRTLSDFLIGIEDALCGWPQAKAKPGMEKRLSNGGSIALSETVSGAEAGQGLYRMHDAFGTLVGLFFYDAQREIFKPEKMLIDGK